MSGVTIHTSEIKVARVSCAEADVGSNTRADIEVRYDNGDMTTPLRLNFGDNDVHLTYEQAQAFFTALRDVMGMN